MKGIILTNLHINFSKGFSIGKYIFIGKVEPPPNKVITRKKNPNKTNLLIIIQCLRFNFILFVINYFSILCNIL